MAYRPLGGATAVIGRHASSARARRSGRDSRDQLREVKLPGGARVVMTYDGLGRRIRKEVLSSEGVALRAVDFLWDGDAIAADLDTARGGDARGSGR